MPREERCREAPADQERFLRERLEREGVLKRMRKRPRGKRERKREQETLLARKRVERELQRLFRRQFGARQPVLKEKTLAINHVDRQEFICRGCGVSYPLGKSVKAYYCACGVRNVVRGEGADA